VAALVLAASAAPAHAQQPAVGSPVTIDGPSSAIGTLGGAAIARDGTGGVVYLKQGHVFVSRLSGGVFQPPEQLDSSFSGPSSQPVIAAGNGGVLLVAFINGGTLYAVDRPGSAGPYVGPIGLFSGAQNPAIAMTNFGKAYLAFTADAGPSSYDVRAAYYYLGNWSLEPTPLNAVPADNAGTGAGRPAIAAAGDGVGIVVWGEDGHIYSRRVWGTAASVAYQQADPPALGGWNETTADTPVAGVGGDSSYVDVAFREELSNGSQEQSRVLMRRLQAGQYDAVSQPDSLSTPGSEGADQPAVTDGEYGTGIVTAEHQSSHELWATLIDGSGASGNTIRVDSLTNASAPDAVPAMAGLYSDLIAWQEDPGTLGMPEIRVRYSVDGTTFGPELVVSSPALGPTQAGSGLAAAGDVDGNAAVVWVQGTGGATRIVAAQLYQPPGAFRAAHSFEYSRSRHPVLRWTPAREHWGLRYLVTVDGVAVGQTPSNDLAVPTSLSNGPHRWQVTAVNGGGQENVAPVARVWIDAVPPAASVTISGTRRVGARVRVHVTYTDAPPGEPAAGASGIARVLVRWGDGSLVRLTAGRHRAAHTYTSRGRFSLTVTVTDRAGNRTVVRKVVRIR
jgi:hypothetical protein